MNTRMRGQNEQVLPLPSALAEQTFRHTDVPVVRRAAAGFGTRAGMGATQLTDFIQAVSEAAACAVAHGPCTARLRLWTAGSRVFCEVSGDGMLMTDRPYSTGGDAERLRHWLLRQLCDHVSMESGPQGITVLLAMTIGALGSSAA
jgi:hypothetical protein